MQVSGTCSLLCDAVRNLPAMTGDPLHIYTAPQLTWRAGRLESASGKGMELLASSHVRRRIIVLDSTLPTREKRRVFIHELHHFVWVRLGNAARGAWSKALRAELDAGIQGELGWSSERRKRVLTRPAIRDSALHWREYVCESFCDTAAYAYARVPGHDEYTLPSAARTHRLRAFRALVREPVRV